MDIRIRRSAAFLLSFLFIISTLFCTSEAKAENHKVDRSLEKRTYDVLTEGQILEGITIGIDPGHQSHANHDTEPQSPGSSVMKAKCSSGTEGLTTWTPEYEVNLKVSLKLASLLEKQGATVIMTRTENDVDVSNIERASIMNDNNVCLAVRIHCNGGYNTAVKGAFMLVPEKGCTDYYDENVRAARAIIDEYCLETGIQKIKDNGLTYRDDQTGFNWCTRPIVCIEMGHLSNAQEELLLIDDAFQDKMARGLYKGLVKFFTEKVQPSPTPTPSIVTDGSIGTAKCLAKSYMNLRKGPGTSYAKVGTLPGAAIVKVYQKSGNWYKIYYKGQYCWASGDYLSVTMYPSSSASTVPTATAAPYPSATKVPSPSTISDSSIGTAKCLAKSYMNLRKGPGTSYTKVGTLPGATIVKVYQKSGNWYKIYYKGQYCWASGDYLSVELNTSPSSSASAAQSSDGSIGTARCLAKSYMNLRKGPGTSYAKVGTLPGATVVKVYQKSGNWYKIYYKGKYCWASGDYLSFKPAF